MQLLLVTSCAPAPAGPYPSLPLDDTRLNALYKPARSSPGDRLPASDITPSVQQVTGRVVSPKLTAASEGPEPPPIPMPAGDAELQSVGPNEKEDGDADAVAASREGKPGSGRIEGESAGHDGPLEACTAEDQAETGKQEEFAGFFQDVNVDMPSSLVSSHGVGIVDVAMHTSDKFDDGDSRGEGNTVRESAGGDIVEDEGMVEAVSWLVDNPPSVAFGPVSPTNEEISADVAERSESNNQEVADVSLSTSAATDPVPMAIEK